jgi:hypothetical protein
MSNNENFDGQTARSIDSLTNILGWDNVAVFRAGEYQDGEQVKVNKATIYVALADPYPEYSKVVFIDGEFHHEGQLLSTEYEGVFEDYLNDYGKAEIIPLSEVSFLERDEYGDLSYVDNRGES